jgi:biopolymer transport protein TolQ
MEETAVNMTELGGVAPGAHDLSIWGLIMHADIVVQAVLVLLVLASLFSWAIIFDKIGRYRRVSAAADTFEDEFWSGRSLEELYDRLQGRSTHPMSLLFVVAMREWQRSQGKAKVAASGARLQERIAQVMRLTLNREIERLERYLGFLATVGSTAPFIGLFGTVWGIMTAFQAIAASESTNLAVVAPGIAEALFATALGLLAAIPAVIAFNKFNSDVGKAVARMEGFADEFSAILSRQIDERG